MSAQPDHSAGVTKIHRRPLRVSVSASSPKKSLPNGANDNVRNRIWNYVTPISFLSHMLVGVVAFQLGLTIGLGRRMISSSSDVHLDSTKWTNHSIFPDSLSSLFTGASMVRRDSFIKEFDVGVPWNQAKPGATDVLLLYGTERSLPFDYYNGTIRRNNIDGKHSGSLIRASYDSALEATKNCHSVKVILTEPNSNHDCVAIVPQWESFHVQNFLRIVSENVKKKEKPHFSSDYPLRLVSRRDTLSGKSSAQIPMSYQSKRYWPMLIDYLQKLQQTLERLRPIVATMNHGKAVVVMVCNFGQSELLVNFVCSARARGLDLSNVLLFATDNDTSTLAKSLGIAVFDVNDAFGDMPTGAAKVYGDRTFQGMMFSKVYCVHLVNALGYDVLFQDVDVVWYRNPLDFFNNSESGNFDFYFQDDGAHSTRYTPYSPNSGFYYVRFNDRTRYFFEVFFRMGELIMASGSHQAVMTGLLADHSSSTGLLIKVFDRDSYLGQEFPGGFHFHKRKDFMKSVVEGKRSPFIFHMSWTMNKENKQKFYQQLGDWYVNEQCINKKFDEIEIPKSDKVDIMKTCCSVEPIVACHFADKPSKIPCKGSPPIDKNGRSFW